MMMCNTIRAMTVAAVVATIAMLLAPAYGGNFRSVKDVECDGKALQDIENVDSMSKCKKFCYAYRGRCGAVIYDKKEDVCHLHAECSSDPGGKGSPKGVKQAVVKNEYTKFSNTACVHGKKIDGVKKAKKLKDCLYECDVRGEDCVAVTLNEKKDKCDLYSECSHAEEDPDKKSAVKQAAYSSFGEGGCEFVWYSESNPDGIAPEGILHNVTLAECRIFCDAVKPCRALTHDAETNDCYVGRQCGQISEGYLSMNTLVKQNSYSIQRDAGCNDDMAYQVPTVLNVGRPNVLSNCLAECDKRSDCRSVVAFTGYDNILNPTNAEDTNCALFQRQCRNITENANTAYAEKPRSGLPLPMS